MNLILITADELRADFVECYGNKTAKTPNIDKMAENGVMFSNYFTCHTKCVPARTIIFSGRYANLGGHRTLGPHLGKDEPNLASLLKEKGYRNIMFGRNHTIDENWLYDIFEDRIAAKVDHLVLNKNVSEDERKSMYFGPIEDKNYKSDTEVWTTQMIEWMENYVKSGDKRPFFLNINWFNPHPPYCAAKNLVDQFDINSIDLLPTCSLDDKPVFMKAIYEIYGLNEKFGKNLDNLKRKILQCYYAQVLDVDIQLGRIIEAIKRLNLSEDTIVIFMSDHGDYVGEYNLVEKWDTGFQDCLIHVPLIMQIPGKNGIEIKGMTESVDIFPTLCELLDLEIPYGINGKSMVHLLDHPDSDFKELVYCEGGHEEALLKIPIDPKDHGKVQKVQNSEKFPGRDTEPNYQLLDSYQGKAQVRNLYPDSLRKAKMIRTKDYKYIYRVVEEDELYDLNKDPNETINFINNPEYKKIVDEMRDLLLNHLVENEETRPFDPFPVA